ncbi:MAG: hypothetical protein JWM86_502 [Thermoleophilia bacterium]|nr:hypothetical protein [Thermoleophilia bacterium]
MPAFPTSTAIRDRLIGGAGQLVNELTGRMPLPFRSMPHAPPGDIFEPRGPIQRIAANSIDRVFSPETRGPQEAREHRPLLAETRIVVPPVSAGEPAPSTRIGFEATAPGANWGARDRTSGMVAVYVDGGYHSTVVVHAERTAPYAVALGALEPGSHDIELRAALDAAPMRPLVHDVVATQVDGSQARLDQLAPIVELRGPGAGRIGSISHTDAPLLLIPALTSRPDGSSTVEYRVTFSNEDGGTNPVGLLAEFGRGVDTEPVLRVDLDPAGRVVEEWYQSPLHVWRRFDGDRVDGRPLVRVSTANNLVSARVHEDGGERWSDAPLPAIDGSQSEFRAMRANPWTWQLMAKELLREHKAIPGRLHDGRRMGDPRGYVYLGDVSQASFGALLVSGGADVRLTDGRVVRARTLPGLLGEDFNETALELPLGVVGAQVAAVAVPDAESVVLGDDLLPRFVGIRA